MNKIYPKKLKLGDTIAVIAPSRSISILSDESKSIANKRFDDLGFKLKFGENVNESNDFLSSSIKSRVSDLHNAFLDPEVDAILTVIGGFNSNQLLRYIDWDIIKSNPKIFCGYSDITALNNAIYTKTGVVTYSGPHYSSFGQKLYLDYSIEYFKKCLMNEQPFEIKATDKWSDDPWYKDQDDRNLIENDGYLVINEGTAEGTVIGSNLCTLNLLQGTEFMPDLDNSILFVEDDEDTNALYFDRNLQSILHLPDFEKVKGLIIGRFQKRSEISNETLIAILKSKSELSNIPIIANVDFGHTDPKITFPIGGEARMNTRNEKIEVLRH